MLEISGMEMGKNIHEDGAGSILWSDSSLGSVVDSATETDGSEEDDEFMAGILAEQMAHSMLDDIDDNGGTGTKIEVEAASLDNRTASFWAESWNPMFHYTTKSEPDQLKTGWSANCWNNTGYSSSSSKVSSQVSSPPSTPGALDDGWDLLHAVAGEVTRLDSDEKSASPGWRGQAGHHHLPEAQWKHASLHDSPLGRNSAGTLPILTKPYAAVVNPNGAWMEEEHNKQPIPARTSNKPSSPNAWNRPQHHQQSQPRATYRCGMAQRPLGHHHWPALSSQAANTNGSGMRAVFLGGTGDRSSSGTGVFLPRSSSDYSTKRKTSCSSVLLPSRIVQVLNLNIEDMRCQPLSGASNNTATAGNGPPMPPIGVETANRFSNSPPVEDWPSGQWKTYTTCSQLHQPSEPTLPTEWSY